MAKRKRKLQADGAIMTVSEIVEEAVASAGDEPAAEAVATAVADDVAAVVEEVVAAAVESAPAEAEAPELVAAIEEAIATEVAAGLKKSGKGKTLQIDDAEVISLLQQLLPLGEGVTAENLVERLRFLVEQQGGGEPEPAAEEIPMDEMSAQLSVVKRENEKLVRRLSMLEEDLERTNFERQVDDLIADGAPAKIRSEAMELGKDMKWSLKALKPYEHLRGKVPTTSKVRRLATSEPDDLKTKKAEVTDETKNTIIANLYGVRSKAK